MKMDVIEQDLQQLFKQYAMLEERVHNIERLLTKEEDD
jgi:hypothetical protein